MAALSGRMAAARLMADLASPAAFDQPVAPGGYAWWYVDALSDDGLHGITLIGFIGSVFSPYYAWARRRGGGDPCALLRAERGALRTRKPPVGDDRTRPRGGPSRRGHA